MRRLFGALLVTTTTTTSPVGTSFRRGAAMARTTSASSGTVAAPPTDGRKRMLRTEIRARLRALPPDYLAAASAAACAKLVASPEFRDAPGIACFCSMDRGELQTATLLAAAFAARKRVFLPRVDSIAERRMTLVEAASLADIATWPRSRWGIPEPPPRGDDDVSSISRADALEVGHGGLSLVVVPGLGFDATCARLGQGAGFYDTWLTRVREQRAAAGEPMPLLVGIGLDEQVVGSRAASSAAERGPHDGGELRPSVADDEGVPTAPHDIRLDRVVTPSHAFEKEEAPRSLIL